MTDVAGNPEEERRADYFYQPWCQEAVCRYFYGKVQQRRMEIEQALGIIYFNDIPFKAGIVLKLPEQNTETMLNHFVKVLAYGQAIRHWNAAAMHILSSCRFVQHSSTARHKHSPAVGGAFISV
ncbi:hypothetical protein AM593_07820, partial [Mytilus galloprovincialis]